MEDQSTWTSDGMCRLCLCSSNDENSVEIFFTNDLSLNVRIMACTGLEVRLLKKKNFANSLIFLLIVNFPSKGDQTRSITQTYLPGMPSHAGEIIFVPK